LIIAVATVWRHTTQNMGPTDVVTRWISCNPNPEDRQSQVALSRDMILVPEGCRKSNWKATVTGDESLFYFSYCHSEKWTINLDDHGSVPRKALEHRKVILAVICSPRGFHIANFLPGRTTMKIAYFTHQILRSLAQALYPQGADPTLLEGLAAVGRHQSTQFSSYNSRNWVAWLGQARQSSLLVGHGIV
jgi:hypothetical protein